MLAEVRMARIIEALERHRFGQLSCVEAAEYLGMSERHFRRLRDRHEADGAEGLIDRRRGRASGRRAAVDRIEWMLEEYRTRYFDFNVKHFHERIKAEHGFEYGYTLTKRTLQQAGLVKRVRRRSVHRRKRERRPLPGMMLMQDGSPHRWIAALARTFDLIATMDDATGEVYSAFLVDEEGTDSSLRGVAEVIEKKGLFCSLYTDRASHYFFTPKAGGGQALAEVLCIQEERQVGKDNCVRYNGLALQIPPQAHRHHFVKATVVVRQYPDGRLAIFHGPRCLARYRADGTMPTTEKAAA